jgi:hypothetical protein
MTLSQIRETWAIKTVYSFLNFSTRKTYFYTQRGIVLIAISLCCLSATAQSLSTSTLNTSGQSASFGNYQFDWSVGEATIIETLTNGNLVVSSGILQPFASNQPAANLVLNWLPTEIKVYPNPTKDILEINMLHKIAGKSRFELIDLQGKKQMEKSFDYNGMGGTERWNLSKLAAGQYFLHIQLIDRITGKIIKNGTFRVLKIQ